MAKKQDEKQEPVPETKAEPKMGETVFFTKSVSTQGGSAVESYPAVILRQAKGGNFQAKDQAVDLVILGIDGCAAVRRDAVMVAEKPTPGRWHR